jgi:hypothetical protein
MKKNAILLLSLLLVSIASAAPSLNFQNEEIQPGETIFATITTSGEFTKEVKTEDISFYEGRKKVFFESDVLFYNGTHYLYIYTTRQGNFSIQVEDVSYKEAGTMGTETIMKNFNITDKIVTDKKTGENMTEILAIKPGFIFTNNVANIKLTNMGTNILEIKYNKIDLLIKPSETQEINLDLEEDFSYLDISTYKNFAIPMISLDADTISDSPLKQLDLRSDPGILFLELFTDNKTSAVIQLLNFGEDNMTNIEATSEISFAKLGKLEDMQPREMQNLTIVFNPKNSGGIQDYINITYEQASKEITLQIPVTLFILLKGSDPEDFEPLENSCEQMEGIVCNIKEVCSGEARFTENGEYCCFEECESTTKNNSGKDFGWIIAIIILVALGIGGYYLYRKQKKTKQKSPKEQIKESTEKFDKRMKGVPETKRISGALTKS